MKNKIAITKNGKLIATMHNVTLDESPYPNSLNILWSIHAAMPILNRDGGHHSYGELKTFAEQKKWTSIHPDHFFRIGKNPGGKVVQWGEDYDRQQRQQQEDYDRQQRQQKAAAQQLQITLGKSRKNRDGDTSISATLIDLGSGESLSFNCRNIFDFGYVINPNYPLFPGDEPGGLATLDQWQGMGDKNRPFTPFEKRCLDFLQKNPPIDPGIRM